MSRSRECILEVGVRQKFVGWNDCTNVNIMDCDPNVTSFVLEQPMLVLRLLPAWRSHVLLI